MGRKHYAKFQKKLMSQSQENVQVNGRTDGRRDRQTLFYRTLPVEARGPTTHLQQATVGNTPNPFLKRMLRHFLKSSPLKNILRF